MQALYIASITFLSLHLLVQMSVWAWLIFRKRKNIPLQKQNRISILIAARNEEKNIVECLQHLEKLHYPKDLIQIIIGDDHSEDNTLSIIENYISGKPHFSVVNIEENLGKARGKANVLAHLAHKANGEYFFITDADIRVPSEWINSLLPHIQNKKNIVSGTTIVKANEKWWQFQQWEWLFLYLLNSFMQDIEPITCSGNNMALSAKAYWETGGYENIDFSVTEDYKLYLELKKHGYTHVQLFEKSATAFSAPTRSFTELLDQRKRWIKGGTGLPFIFWFFMVIYSLFLPSIIALFFLSPIAGIIFLSGKIVLEFILFTISSKQLSISLKWILFPVFEIYTQFITITNFINLLLPGKVRWKGREF